MTSFETILVERPEPTITRIVMNRPDARNAQNLQMTYDLNAAFDQAVQDDMVKVIILAGNGPHFSSGHDLRPGGKWYEVGSTDDGRPFRVEGEYLEIDPPRLLVHTRSANFAENIPTVVRWELEPHEVHGLHGSGTHRVGTGTYRGRYYSLHSDSFNA